MVGLIPSSGNGKSQDENSLALDAASELNKLLQTGISTMTTKTAGAFEQGDSPTISLGVSGNGQPSVIVPMLRGTYGNDAVAVSFRFLFSSGRPIEPYSSLPLSLTLPLSFKRWLWPKLLPCMVMPLGLPAGVHLWKAAENTFDKARLGDHKNDADHEEPGADESMKPNKSGYVVTLVDGSSTRLRFQYDGEQWVPELRTANRDIPIETGMDLQSMAKRVLAHFSKPHEEVPWKDEARLTFTGFQILFDAQCAVARDQGDETLAARLGASPWHLGMLAVAILVLEIAVEEDGVKDDRGIAYVETHHVVRSYDVLRVFHGIRDIYESGPPEALALATQRQQGREAAVRRSAATPVPVQDRAGWGEFAPTQLTPRPPRSRVHLTADCASLLPSRPWNATRR